MKYERIKPQVSVDGLDLPRLEREIAAMRRLLAVRDEHARLRKRLEEEGLALSDAARTMAEIVAFVAEKYGVTVDDIRGNHRPKFYGPARHEAMWLMRQRRLPSGGYRWSLPRIGTFMGGRDHTTVIYGVDKHQARIDAGEVQP